MRKATAIFCGMIALLAAGGALANPYDVFGVGSRAISMSNAFTAVCDDISACYYNPAGLAQVTRFQVEGGYFYAEPKLYIDGEDVGADQNKGTYIGVASSMVFYGHRWTVSVNAFVPDQHVMRFMMLPESQPRFTMYSNRTHTVAAYVCTGLQVFKWLAIGGGISFLGDNKGGVDFKIQENEPSVGSLESEIGSMLTPLAGVLFTPIHPVRIGFSWREGMDVPLNLPNRIIIPDLTVFEENPIPILRKTLLTLLATSYSHFSPTQYALGASWRITDRVLVAADATYYQWSEMQNPTPFTELELVGGLGDLFPVVQAPPPPDPDFRDVIVPAVGVEITAFTSKYFELLTRAGYSYRPTPVPDQVKETNFVDSDTHLMSGGLGFQFKEFMELVPRPFTLDFYFQYFLLEDRRIIKEDLADAVGDYEASGGVFHGGGTITLRF